MISKLHNDVKNTNNIKTYVMSVNNYVMGQINIVTQRYVIMSKSLS